MIDWKHIDKKYQDLVKEVRHAFAPLRGDVDGGTPGAPTPVTVPKRGGVTTTDEPERSLEPLATKLWDVFGEDQAPNFVEMSFDGDSRGPIHVLVLRPGRPSPAELIERLKMNLAAIPGDVDYVRHNLGSQTVDREAALKAVEDRIRIRIGAASAASGGFPKDEAVVHHPTATTATAVADAL